MLFSEFPVTRHLKWVEVVLSVRLEVVKNGLVVRWVSMVIFLDLLIVLFMLFLWLMVVHQDNKI
jgi:hypothetical protein